MFPTGCVLFIRLTGNRGSFRLQNGGGHDQRLTWDDLNLAKRKTKSLAWIALGVVQVLPDGLQLQSMGNPYCSCKLR